MPLRTPEQMEQNLIPRLEITWTNCTDVMPIDGWSKIIFRDGNIVKPIVCYSISVYDFKNNNALKPSAEWTSYTPEKWKELNK